jgi:hypothetical protein
MGFQYVVPAVVGGTVLIIERIQSQNYVTTVSGWAINADGTAEFKDVILIGGMFSTDTPPNPRVVINDPAYPNEIVMYTGSPDETAPARIQPVDSGGTIYMRLRAPATTAVPSPAEILMEANEGSGTRNIEISTDDYDLFADTTTIDGFTSLRLGDGTDYLTVVSLPNSVEIRLEGETWHGTAATPLAGTWVDTAGSRFGYFVDATGRVQVRGRVSGGGAGATVVTLPVGYRPTSNLEFTMRAGTVVSAVSVSTAGVLTVTANLATASASGINLDCISFPTF